MNHEQIEQVAAVFDAAPSVVEIEVRSATAALRLRRRVAPSGKSAASAAKTAVPTAAAALAAGGTAAAAAAAGASLVNVSGSAPVSSASSPGAEDAEDTVAADGNALVTAHMVGVFRATARTGHKGAVPAAVGDTVFEGQSLGSVETMRILNDCAAPVGGVLHAVFVDDGQPVEYGQALFEIAPASASAADATGASLPVTES